MEKAKKELSPDYLQKRVELIALTNALGIVKDATGAQTYNELIVQSYAQQVGCLPTDFAHYMKWKERGMQVKKGEKGFAVWSRPKDTIKQEVKPETPTDEKKFFGLAYLFHFGQVEPLKTA